MTGCRSYSPLVSVVMSIYNEPLQWISCAVESILCQSYTNLEFIVVCDNPDFEEGISYIRNIEKKDSRVRLVINASNLGPTRSFNVAIALSSGKYIARMDADDYSLPERFARQVEYLEAHPEVSVCATDVHNIDEKGKITRRNRYKNKQNPALNIISTSMAHPSVMFRRSLLEFRDPIYNEEYRFSQDYELWTSLILEGHKFHTLEEVLLHYRRSSSQISSSKKKVQVECFKRAHRTFILKWLTQKGIITEEDSSDLKLMLNKVTEAIGKAEGQDKEYLRLIAYVFYFSLGSDSWKYRFKYLFDRNLLVFRIGFMHTFRLFVSRKTRRSRTGFN